MHDQALLRYHLHSQIEPAEGSSEDTVDWYYATVTVGGKRIAKSPMYPWPSARDLWVSELKTAVATKTCRCGIPIQFVEDIDGTEVFGYCSDGCRMDALDERHREEMWK